MAQLGDEPPEQQGYQLQKQHYYKIVTSYMPESFEQDAVQIALVAVDKYRQLKDIAFYIKHEYDRKYPGSGKATEGVYHCIVGKSFASKYRGTLGARRAVERLGAVRSNTRVCFRTITPRQFSSCFRRRCQPRNAAIHPHEGREAQHGVPCALPT